MAATIYVSFTDSNDTAINGVFDGPGNSTEIGPHQGTVLSNDAPIAYYDAQGQRAAATGLIAPGN